MPAYVYTTTNSDEVKEILKDYNLMIFNIEKNLGRGIQEKLGLGFNPASFFIKPGNISEKELSILIGKLVAERQFVAVHNGIKREYFPRRND